MRRGQAGARGRRYSSSAVVFFFVFGLGLFLVSSASSVFVDRGVAAAAAGAPPSARALMSAAVVPSSPTTLTLTVAVTLLREPDVHRVVTEFLDGLGEHDVVALELRADGLGDLRGDVGGADGAEELAGASRPWR